MVGTVTTPASTAESPLSLEQWLDRLCLADDLHDARWVGIKAIEAGYQLQRVTCDRCTAAPHLRQVFTFVGAVRHIIETEASWRDAHREDGPNAALHKPGDLRAATPADTGRPPAPWSSSPCRYCGEPVVWALTKTGKRMPVDPQPDPAGNVVLTTTTGSLSETPLALVLGSADQRAEVNPDDLHTSHMQTCQQRPTR